MDILLLWRLRRAFADQPLMEFTMEREKDRKTVCGACGSGSRRACGEGLVRIDKPYSS